MGEGQIISSADVDGLRNYLATLPPDVQHVSPVRALLEKLENDRDLLQRTGEMQVEIVRDLISADDLAALRTALRNLAGSNQPMARALEPALRALLSRISPPTTKKGWIVPQRGEAQEIPGYVLDDEIISWPFTVPESARHLYRRHEIVPEEAFLYVLENLSPRSVPEQKIRELLGPLSSKRPTRFGVAAGDLQFISNGIADQTLETYPHCTLMIPIAMWNDANQATRTIFHNMCQAHRVKYQVNDVGMSAFWDCG
jgi:hypothetical protein